MTNLKILSLQNNSLIKIENLNNLIKLDELYLSENGIEIIENLENNVNLGTLDLSMNKVSKIENIIHLQNLKELWVRTYMKKYIVFHTIIMYLLLYLNKLFYYIYNLFLD